MKLTLMIEGSVAAIAAVLAKLDNNVTVTTHPELPFSGVTSPQVEAIAQTHGISPTPALQTADTVTAPVTSMAMPTLAPVDADDDDNNPVDVGAPDVDSKGMPWDKRIHASSKATVADGTWRMRRGVDKAIIDVVEAELKGVAAPVMPQMPAEYVTPTPLPIAMQMPVAVEAAETPIQMPVVTQQQPQTVPVPETTASPAAVSFPDFMMKLSQNMAGDTPVIVPDYLITVVQRVNMAFSTDLKAITDLGAHPDKLSWAVALMAGEGRW